MSTDIFLDLLFPDLSETKNQILITGMKYYAKQPEIFGVDLFWTEILFHIGKNEEKLKIHWSDIEKITTKIEEYLRKLKKLKKSNKSLANTLIKTNLQIPEVGE